MSDTIQEYTGTLTVMRCWCGIQHAVPQSLADQQRRNRDNDLAPLRIFCPLGHGYFLAGTSEVDSIPGSGRKSNDGR